MPQNESIEGIFFFGQSNAGDGGEQSATFTRSLFPDAMLGFATPEGVLGGDAGDFSRAGGFTTYCTRIGTSLSSAVAAANALVQFTIDADQTVRRRFWHTVWDGGRPISYFLKHTNSYNELLLSARLFVNYAIAARLSPVIPAIVWIQGESPEDKYGEKLLQLVSSLIPDIMIETGQEVAPKFIIFQTNNNLAFANYDDTPIEQLAVTRNNPNCLLAGPMYYAPMESYTIDENTLVGIHGNEVGRMMIGEIIALCLKSLLTDQTPWSPLAPVCCSRSLRNITIQYAKPTYGDELIWDTNWIGPTPNYGFGCRDDSSSISISSLYLDKINYRVHIELNQAPVGKNPMVSYAIGPGEHTVLAPWSAVRGQLMCTTKQQSLFQRQGYPLPMFVNHYGVRFEARI